MGKSARKNKEKKKDFQKVKLKAGKTKPKADNFTDTTFKSRAIQIRDQLKSSEKGGDEPVTQRKQNIQDLLCQINHYNSSVRSSAIQGIKSLLTSHPTLLHEQLPTFIAALPTVMSDKEGVVRQAGSALLRVVMDALPANQMSPFFSVICMHLCCAMTHIQEDIQLDSLVVMETVLQHYPGLVVPHSKELLTNFIHLISQQRSKLGSSGSLKVNPSGKLAGQKWRFKVLQMLQKLLEVINGTKETGSFAECGRVLAAIYVNSEPGKPTHTPLMKTSGVLNWNQKPFALRADQSTTGTGGDFLSSPLAIMEVSQTLVPLLLQCWGEVNLASQGKGKGWLTLGLKEGETLRCVLAILQTVWDLLGRACREKGDDSALAEMRKTYQRKFEQHFVQGFPYSLHHPSLSKPKKGKLKSTGEPAKSLSAIPINIATCDLILSVLVTNGNKPRPWLRMVREFVEDVLRGDVGEDERLTKEEQDVLINVVRRMFERTDDEDQAKLLDALYSYYLGAHPLSQHKLTALRSFRDLCLETARPGQGNQSAKLRDFFHSLGQLMSDSRSGSLGTSQEALHTLLVAASRGYADAITCIQMNCSDWLDGEDAVIYSLDEPSQQRLLGSLYYLPCFDSRLVSNLTRHCCRGSVDVKVPVYLLVNRCLENVFGATKSPLSHPAFIDFLLTTSMGLSYEDLTLLQAKVSSDAKRYPTLGNSCAVGSVQPCYHILHDTTELGQLQRFIAINKVITGVYKRFPKHDMVLDAVCTRIKDTLTTCHHLPIQTTCSILAHASIVMGTTTSSSSSSTPEQSVDSLLGSLVFLTLCRLAVSRKSDRERGEESVVTTMWQLAVDCVAACGDNMINMLLQHAYDASKECWSRDVGVVMISLLQTDSVKGRLRCHGDKLHSLVQRMSEQLLPAMDGQCFAEFRYEVSLLPKDGQMDQGEH